MEKISFQQEVFHVYINILNDYQLFHKYFKVS